MKITITPADSVPITVEYRDGMVHSFNARQIVIEGELYNIVISPSAPVAYDLKRTDEKENAK